LRDAGLKVQDVSDVTGFPEMLDGRVKTLHPMIHGGLLGDRTNASHKEQMQKHGIAGIDLLCVNLYQFEKTVTGDHDLEQAIESIDIGGPAMVRAGAKNHNNVAVVVDPCDYDDVIGAIKGGTLKERSLSLAAKAFRHTAYYDSVVSRYLTGVAGADPLTETATMGYRRKQEMRYGENPHQSAALYTDPLQKGGVAHARQLWGKELSYNNLLDSDAAWELVCDLPEGACAVIKHGNPCGAAVGPTLGESFRLARASDPISAFGGIAVFHGAVDLATAEAMTEKGNFLEVVIATSFSEEAQKVFQERKGWGQSVRLLEAPISARDSYLAVRSVRGGALLQDSDEDPGGEWSVVTERKPSEDQMAAARFAWSVIPHVKSNAIVVCAKNRLLGVGAGQMNRVQSVRLALAQAGEGAMGAVLASDAFFPFPDSIETAAEAGISCVIQPGGSKKDDEVIAAADRLCISMVTTGVRHFRH
ncbi:MAG TPA: bifunctional phosphoribosylaminoimidazolecarboxamide formyltransferase/IMP cyclohydrolase, partial [Fimbriimonadaceae bacterium]|nr:bifunctional phosphoribosylaminoimidazolecarboxamide formyltransferase/IMP cyclohydrolase [Fimbriimonadaceae bacterium]